jgi:hypothetical protein
MQRPVPEVLVFVFEDAAVLGRVHGFGGPSVGSALGGADSLRAA